MTRLLRASTCLASMLALSACAHDGLSDFQTGQSAMQKLTNLTMTWKTTTRFGVFRDTVELDCGGSYYHHKATKDLTDKAIEDGRTLKQGKPTAHQESEDLIVGGQTYHRNTSNWEDARSSDASEWHVSTWTHDVAADCHALRDGEDNVLVPMKRIVTAQRIEYQTSRTVDGASCREYAVTYPDPAYSDEMKTTRLNSGEMYSERVVVMKPASATICLDASTSLPVASARENVVTTFSYGPITKIAPPVR